MVQRETQQEEPFLCSVGADILRQGSVNGAIQPGCVHQTPGHQAELPRGKRNQEKLSFYLWTKPVPIKILFQTGRKGEVERKGHPVPLHVAIQDKATGPAHCSMIALKGL